MGVPLRILVAEDNEFNRDLLEHMLAGQGLSATMVVDGREALALLEREPFDLLLLDIHMPELDGFQVVRGDPGARANGGRPPARHRLDRAVAEGGPRAVLAGGHGRIPHQAVQRR